jgi:hypothetical protein
MRGQRLREIARLIVKPSSLPFGQLAVAADEASLHSVSFTVLGGSMEALDTSVAPWG